ncbi:LysM peptidoglycan-binding domain-containing protein [Actinomycetaceae bacterium WB03_NA08]|uniref:LysM peptidoglycan-binding domain-containing protein n=1 Tax=Scrofimicrobium canadense TaxID=2652290 RepID=A0A6N7W578_9ACTO|nr:LysM peptidoglycan-binding domain-containing protein [Scrofimicrobium canadense]MSS83602.1 LysM peptidoglycan-binding domain-containing protein [Scrofimicrobium canadense]
MSAAALSPQDGAQRPQLWVVPDLPARVESAPKAGVEATVRHIRTAPSVIEMERARLRHPSVRARRQTDAMHGTAKKILVQCIAYCFALFLVVALGAGVGMVLQPGTYSGQAVQHSVDTGDTLWGLAASIGAERPILDVIEDIKALNGLEGDGLVAGQQIILPVE